MHHFFRSTPWLLAMLLLSQNAFGFSVSRIGDKDLKWHNNQIPYRMHSAGSDDISNGTDLAQIQAGFADWEAIGCSVVYFNYQGTTENRAVTAIGQMSNGVNEIVWVEDQNWPHGQWVLGVTGPISDWHGKILEADIAFNGLQHSWSTTGSPGWGNQQDVKNVAIHEEGHFIGAQHVLEYNQWDPPTMAPAADPGLKTASLEDDDKMVACYLYPPNGFYNCDAHSDCPDVVDNYSNGQEYYAAYGECHGGSCINSSTVPVENCGAGQIGDPCFNDEACDCAFYCQDTGMGTGSVCSKQCSIFSNDCPSDYSCIAFSGDGTQGACLPTACREAGQACNAKDDCCSNVCVATGVTAGFFCRDNCTVGQDACAAGQECIQIEANSSEGACMPKKNPVGEVCGTNDDCKSGKCRSLTGEADTFFCTGPCDEQTECPCSMTCVRAGAEKVCIPGENPSCNETPNPPNPGNGDATGSSDIGATTPSSGSGCASSRSAPQNAALFILTALFLLLRRRRKEDVA